MKVTNPTDRRYSYNDIERGAGKISDFTQSHLPLSI